MLTGQILGHAVYDVFVGNPSPESPRLNPIGYFATPADFATTRLCAADAEQTPKDFAPGHDHVTTHERIANVGTTRDFLA
jgi:hypothetical protein